MVVSTHGKGITPGEFLMRRIIRIVPLYWVATLLVVGCALTRLAFKGEAITAETVAKSLLFIPYDSLMDPGHAWPILIPGWTLNYEMFFYALFAVSLFVRHRLASLMSSIGILVLAGVLFPPNTTIGEAYTSPLLLEFLVGALIAAAWLRGARLGMAASGVLIALGAACIALRDYLPQTSQLLGASLIVAGCLNAKLAEMEIRPLLLLGDASYSIYLSQYFFLIGLKVVWVHSVHRDSAALSVGFMGAALIGSALAGIAVYRWVEQPMTERLQRIRRAMILATA